ncbi:hypothetical protein C8J56DRAFT_499654 [Mycena floridula]|nr:hypothetical protein C8J56DRAFT_499654 [Mycena floridula]
MPAPNDKLYGRDEDVQEIVRILIRNPASSNAERARFALLGADGEGKTALALEVMAQPAMKETYSAKNSVWIPCEEATSAEMLLSVIYTSLDITEDSPDTIQDILAELGRSSNPIILLLDNFETPWNAPGAREAVAGILRDISLLRHVALFITIRATVAPCEEIAWEEKIIQALDPEASRQLYTAIDEKVQGDGNLEELLGMLGHTALAVKLIARHGKNNGLTVQELMSSYKGHNEGSNSVSVSICMTLESSLVKDQLNASRLLTIIAILPSGATLDRVQQYWARDLDNLDAAFQTILEASLLECWSSRYFVLPVIRSYILDPSRFPDDVRHSMVLAACSFLQQHNSVEPGKPIFIDDMNARAIEEVNLQSILLETTEPNSEVVEALRILAWHQIKVRPRLEVIEHAAKLVSKVADQNLVGQIFQCYGAALFSLNRYEDARKQRTISQNAFRAASEPTVV